MRSLCILRILSWLRLLRSTISAIPAVGRATTSYQIITINNSE